MQQVYVSEYIILIVAHLSWDIVDAMGKGINCNCTNGTELNERGATMATIGQWQRPEHVHHWQPIVLTNELTLLYLAPKCKRWQQKTTTKHLIYWLSRDTVFHL